MMKTVFISSLAECLQAAYAVSTPGNHILQLCTDVAKVTANWLCIWGWGLGVLKELEVKQTPYKHQNKQKH